VKNRRHSGSKEFQQVAIRVLAIAISLAFLAMRSLAEEQLHPPVTILVFNYSRATHSTLVSAEREAGRILAEAGVSAKWLQCSIPLTADSDKACAREVGASDIRMPIVEQANQGYVGDSAFGFALAPALASVFHKSAERLAHNDNTDSEMAVILGCVIAHEIGHLLLGNNAHSESGIMQREWKREQLTQAMRGRLLFTVEQAETIREQAQVRDRLQREAVASVHP
jgi:hypothetical protein